MSVGTGLGRGAWSPAAVLSPPSRRRKYAENMYYFSELALTLNAPESGTAPTDSRRRPDQRLMENGRWDEANAEKQRLEEKQRLSRKKREAEAARATEDGKERAGGAPEPPVPAALTPSPCPQAPRTTPTSRCGSSARRTRSPRSWRTSTGAATGRAKRSRTGPSARTFSEGWEEQRGRGLRGCPGGERLWQPAPVRLSVRPSHRPLRAPAALTRRGCLSPSTLTLTLGSGSQPGPPRPRGLPRPPPMRVLVPGPLAQERRRPGWLPGTDGMGTRPPWGGHRGVSPRLALVSSPPPLVFHLPFAPRCLGAFRGGGPASLTPRGPPRRARSLFSRCTLYPCRDLAGAPVPPPPCSYPGVRPPRRAFLSGRGARLLPPTLHTTAEPRDVLGAGGGGAGVCRSGAAPPLGAWGWQAVALHAAERAGGV